MSNTAKDLNASRIEALQGLLNSLGHASGSSGNTPSTEQLHRLSEEINKVLGGGSKDHNLSPGVQPDQLLNGDGLPIVDITEPADEGPQATILPTLSPDRDLIPLSLLPPAERERRRQERLRILDLLEEEEHLQQLQEERDAEEERKEGIRNRKESAKAELYQLRAARELQKKMGQALVRHAKGTRESDQDAHTKPQPQTPSSNVKKTVSFADVPTTRVDKRDQQVPVHQSNWGDISLGRLRAKSRVHLVSTAEAQKYPMKLHVVERRPVSTPTSSPRDEADSDDESISSDVHPSPPLENDSAGEDKSSSSNSLSDEVPWAEGFDYDIAQHHREIALGYYQKRHAIGAETAKALSEHIEDGNDQQGIPSERLPLSRFRADRMTAAYDRSYTSVSTSLGPAVIPASRQNSLRHSVRLGKLENGQLVGGESGESGSEDESVREVIRMLQEGNIQNVGPDFRPPPMSPTRNPDTVESQVTRTSTLTHGVKPSKLGEGIAETTTPVDNISRERVKSQPAISSVVERTFTKQHILTNKPQTLPQPRTSGVRPPIIIDSPSFPMPLTSPTSPALALTSVPPSPYPTEHEHPPSVDVNSPLAPWPWVPPHRPLSVERPVSRFMAERKKLTEGSTHP